MKYYKGINRKQSYTEYDLKRLKGLYRYDDSPFVIYNEDLVTLTNTAWPSISKGDARKNPAIKFPKGFKDFDFCVIQYGKKTYPHVPKICLLNPDLFFLTELPYKPDGLGIFFLDYMDFINAMGIYSEKDIDEIPKVAD